MLDMARLGQSGDRRVGRRIDSNELGQTSDVPRDAYSIVLGPDDVQLGPHQRPL